VTDGPHYYRHDLALVHDRGFGAHAEACAPGVLARLAPVRARGGTVLELGCGSGHLTRHLVAAGHRVVATDASPAMVELARAAVPGAEDVRRLRLPDDPLPPCDAVVSVGHVLSYLADEAAVERALVAAAGALAPGGVLAVDLCDLRLGDAVGAGRSTGRAAEDWAVVAESTVPARGRLTRRITTFVRAGGDAWRRDDEVHENVLLDTGALPALLARHGVAAEPAPGFGDDRLPEGLVALVGRRTG
jgi:SAM-dependent methyltransferase